MTVTATNRKNQFTTNGVTVDFPFTFAISNIAQVVALTVVGDVETPYTNFTVVKHPTTEGGTLTTNDVLDDLDLLVFRDTSLTQQTNYTPGGRFPAQSHEEALDKLTLQNQEQQEEIDRSLKSSISTELPYEVSPNLVEDELLLMSDSVVQSSGETLESLNDKIDDRIADSLQEAKDFTYARSTIDAKDVATLNKAKDYTYSKAEADGRFTEESPADTTTYVRRSQQWVQMSGIPFFKVGCGETHMECGELEASAGDFDFIYPQGFTPNP